MRLLIIEDEKRLAENIAQALREAGFAVDYAADGITGSHMAVQDIFDAIILDLMLPGKSGKRVLTELRQTKSRTPVLVLTALEGKETIVDLLNSGADDYLAKPFDLGELLARVKALIRRAKGVSSTIIQVADMEIDTVRQTVKRRGQEIDLSPMEYRILQYLSYRPRAIVSKQELLEHLYDFEWEHHSNVIEAHISNLRRKLNLQGTEPLIETLRHRGYRLSEEASS
ncbi:response regulator transcription factor [Terriglobus albidus]|uniref:Response regulator transcription factor n=1 Tax=Terriglobus albidus TaxID=1592106 RepID=A0A5B9E9Y4_9BACT|nr:response regulator transcription factor [Terriglobus albidus]QEE28474.1 response regulator transcription factor [Terriglobus albidus]